jgi:hypothetical protein
VVTRASSNRWRFTLRQLLIAVACIGLSLGLAIEAGPFLVNPMALACAVCGCCGTTYADCFSERRFERIRVGMSAAQVEEEMGGPPISIMPYPSSQQEYWSYSGPATGGCYWRRAVLFTRGRVTNIMTDYYID